jgi:hypothetical protein
VTDPAQAGWPKDVQPISADDLERLGIDSRDRLFWDGRRVEVRRRLDLTRWQKLAAVLVTVFAVLGGIGGFLSGFTDAAGILCARGVHVLSCPLGAAGAR